MVYSSWFDAEYYSVAYCLLPIPYSLFPIYLTLGRRRASSFSAKLRLLSESMRSIRG